MSKQKHLVIGLGEVGSALKDIFDCEGSDKTDAKLSMKEYLNLLEERYTREKEKGLDVSTIHYDIIHIAFPYSDSFKKYVSFYQKLYTPKITVIHSTVPVGTSREVGAIHSPVHGIHPNLVEGIKTFVKYIGATDREQAEEVLRFYQEKGIKGYIVKNPETSEISKLGCTTRHALMIIEQKLFKKMCEEHGADFQEAYSQWNGHYTEGYRELGKPYLQRAIVKDMPGPIGGHCIVSNLKLLRGEVADFVSEQNEKL